MRKWRRLSLLASLSKSAAFLCTFSLIYRRSQPSTKHRLTAFRIPFSLSGCSYAPPRVHGPWTLISPCPSSSCPCVSSCPVYARCAETGPYSSNDVVATSSVSVHATVHAAFPGRELARTKLCRTTTLTTNASVRDSTRQHASESA